MNEGKGGRERRSVSVGQKADHDTHSIERMSWGGEAMAIK